MAPKTSFPTSYVRPDRALFYKAWQIFVFSSMFAVLLNAFYPDGIDLKYRPPKKVNLSSLLQSTPEPTTPYSGWKNPGNKPTRTTPVPVLTDTSRIPRLSLSGIRERFDKKTAILLDARNPDKYGEGHIPGAVNFPANELDQFAPKVMPQLTDKGREIVCYCDGGDCTLSLELAKTLIDQGFRKVEVFEGGWPQWDKAGYPAQKGEIP